jgi:DNA-directed RNA polymerase specialized sigma24 family protein
MPCSDGSQQIPPETSKRFARRGGLTSVVEEPGGAMVSAAKGTPAERRCFETFFLEQRARLFGTLCLVTGDAAGAEELMQESFVRVWERWDRVSGHPDPTGYLYRTAFNVFRSRARRAVRPARRVLSMELFTDPFPGVDDRHGLLGALRTLPPGSVRRSS